MKTKQLILRKAVTTIFIVAAMFSITSCKGQKEKSDNKKENSVSQTNVKPPSVDIHTATFLGNLDAVRQHISAGSDLNVKDQYGSTPLIIATLFGKTEVAISLIEAGTDLHITGNDGSTPLHTAAFFCRTEIVKALLANGADKTLKNNYGSTPLASVTTPFNDVKGIYDQFSKDLGPLGFKLDYKHLELTRPIIAEMLQ